MTAGGVAFVPLDARPPRTLSFSPLFKPSMLTIYSTLLYEGGRLCFEPDGVGVKPAMTVRREASTLSASKQAGMTG